MRTNQERVRIGLDPIYVPAPKDVVRRLDLGSDQPLFHCWWPCALEGPWETTVVDPGERDTLLCPSCLNTVGTIEMDY